MTIAVGDVVWYPRPTPDPNEVTTGWVPKALAPLLRSEPPTLWEVTALEPENGACVIERSIALSRDAFGCVDGVRQLELWVFIDEVELCPKAMKLRAFRL
jgi:hypothetical protein